MSVSVKRPPNEAQSRKNKLANSYQELLDEFGVNDLKSVGAYTLGRLIGKGSFGKVYLATHKLTNGSKVVLKSAKKDDSNLAREIHHHRQFVHPHIARLYEVIVTENMVWLVLEYCSGDELYNYLLQHGKLPVEKVQKTFAQLVGAVSYVHLQSCVHRDLKLENILLDKNENVKLLDFGFAREYEGKTNYLQTFCGTVCYSAPEMLKGEKYAGEKVDVWSLGVILYALLCGELPFDEDDDNLTRTKILSEEPKWPDHVPSDALALLKSMLSKRPFPRPNLSTILAHPFLAEHAPEQQATLAIERKQPFTTPLEKETLQRMRGAGVDTDSVMESVLAQKCDTLAGWWTLLIEKEERKQVKRDRKRKEKESDRRSSRRFSQASSRLERLAPVEEIGQNGQSQFLQLGEPLPRTRGRSQKRRSTHLDVSHSDLPVLPEVGNFNGHVMSDHDIPPTPVDKDSIRSVSTSRHRRPLPPPKEGVLRSARSRGSTLHLVTTGEVLEPVKVGLPTLQPPKTKKRGSQAIVAQVKHWTQWLKENTKRHRHSNQGPASTPNLHAKNGSTKESKSPKESGTPRPHTSKSKTPTVELAPAAPGSSSEVPPRPLTNGHQRSYSPLTVPNSSSNLHSPVLAGPSNLAAGYPRRMNSGASHKRQSLSPSPLTPRSTVRRTSAGLRGRKSTSSSVSSIRSMPHHHHTHSKASSTSSNNSVSTNVSKTPLRNARSPHRSVKVLPSTPTATSFPSNIRLVRGQGLGNGPMLAAFDEDADESASSQQPQQQQTRDENTPIIRQPQPPGQRNVSPNPFGTSFADRLNGGGVLFAKRKRNIFKGPMLAFNGGTSSGGSGGGAHVGGGSGSTTTHVRTSGSHSRNGSIDRLGARRSGEITIQEEDEEEGEHGDLLAPLDYKLAGRGRGAGAGAGAGAGSSAAISPGAHPMDIVEEVDVFSPLVQGPGEIVEERIYEEGEIEDEDTEATPRARRVT